jgi:hypothetical protein
MGFMQENRMSHLRRDALFDTRVSFLSKPDTLLNRFC